MISKKRIRILEKNFSRLFWIRAFLNIKLINIVLSLFYIHRGLTLSQIFYLGIFWALASLLFEVPSSYLADQWGRKKTILLGCAFMIGYWVMMFFGHGFFWLAAAVTSYGISFACMSGTDEALMYDTARELGREKTSLRKLGKFRSANNAFKIFSPIIAVFIAKDLTGMQFQLLLGADIIFSIVAVILATRLVESNHKMDVVDVEAGVMADAVNMIRRDKGLVRAILNKEFIFFAVFVPWSIYQAFFVDFGLSIIFIGLVWGVRHAVVFLWCWFAGRIAGGRGMASILNRLGDVYTVGALILAICLYTGVAPMWLFLLYTAGNVFQSFRDPFFSEFFHKRFRSYNRATTASLSNLLHNVVEIPLMLLSGMFVMVDARYAFLLSFILGLIVVLFLRIPSAKKQTFL